MQMNSNMAYGALSDEAELDSVASDSSLDKILEGLNDSQREAVSAPLTNMLIIAGAGTGKTRVLVSRISWLLKKERIEPRRILAVTFTNKAATEMRERIALLVGEEYQRQLWANTFHSICLRLLRAYANAAGLQVGFTVLDTDNQNTLVKRIMKDMNIDIKEIKPADVVSKISSLKEKGIRSAAYDKMGRKFGEPNFVEISQIYAAYERICNQENSVDFSELLLRTVELLENNAEIRDLQHRRFKEILVDEFQDTNSIQYKFLTLMAGPQSHVLVVGDDDQSIYGWRGADYTNMKKFLIEFKDVKEVLLALNYRSSQKILDVANTLIELNEDRLMEKVLKGNIGRGENVQILNCGDNRAEASKVANIIKDLHENGEKYKDMAILYRNNYLSLGFEQRLTSKHIPFVIFGGQKFFERAEILDALAYLRLLINEDDDTAALRIINVPARKIGPKVVADLRAICAERNCSILKAIKLLSVYVQDPNADKALKTLYKKIEPFYALIESLKVQKEALPLNELVDVMLQQTGLYEFYQAKDAKEGKDNEEHSRYGNLGMLVSNVKEFISSFEENEAEMIDKVEEETSEKDAALETDPLLTYLSNITLVSTGELSEDGSDSPVVDAVNMMTMHASKGLEFKYVFLVGFESGILPSKRAEMSESEKGLSEERRLAYVGITRAKTELFISYAQSRNLFGSQNAAGASLFLRDIVRKYNGQTEKPYVIVKCQDTVF